MVDDEIRQINKQIKEIEFEQFEADIKNEEVKEKFREAEKRLQRRLGQPIFKKGGIKTGLGKPMKKKVNIGRATKALKQLI